jgi:glycosyltransferase involved in cell wall biosynthesis
MPTNRWPGCKPTPVGRIGCDDPPLVKVAFDSRPAKDVRGIGRYTRCLLDALRQERDGDIVETHDPRRCQVFHAPWIDGAMLRCPVPMVVTLHDLVPLKRRGEYLRTGLRFKLRYLAVERAARVIVPTRAVARDLVASLAVCEEQVAVIAEAAAPAFRPRSQEEVAAVRERFALPEHYVLWVGGLREPDPRKRVSELARARRNMPLVLVGPTGRWAHELPGVKLTGRVSDDELAAIYTGAHALVMASDEEGFGLTPVEALACGTPVAACDVPAVREVIGDRATLTDVNDLNALFEAAECACRPAPSPPAWTWGQAAKATWEVYEQALERPDVGGRRAGAGGGRSSRLGRRAQPERR